MFIFFNNSLPPIPQNRLKIVFQEPSQTINFVSDTLYIGIYTHQDLDLQIRAKFDNLQRDNEETPELNEKQKLTGEQKIQLFIQQKQQQKLLEV